MVARESLSDIVLYEGPSIFTRADLPEEARELFAERAALVYTPTSELPTAMVGEGPLDVTLPLATPDYLDVTVNGLGRPRTWLDLLQRATGRLRWKPMFPAKVVLTRHDRVLLRQVHLVAGVKGLLDALKVSTYGRPDGHLLHYLGAIADDDNESVDVEVKQTLIDSWADAHMRVAVTPL